MSISFRKAYCLHKHVVCTTILWIISLWSPCLGSGLIVLFPAAFCSTPARHAPRSVSMPVISRSGPTAAETRRRLRTRGSKHGSGGWVGDGLALSPPVFPRSSGFRTTGSDGGCAQRGYFWPAVHEIPRVVAQDQGVLPEGKPASDAQGHAELPSRRRHVEETLVLISGPGAGSFLSPRTLVMVVSRGHGWQLSPRSVEWSPSHVAHQLPGDCWPCFITNFLP